MLDACVNYDITCLRLRDVRGLNGDAMFLTFFLQPDSLDAADPDEGQDQDGRGDDEGVERRRRRPHLVGGLLGGFPGFTNPCGEGGGAPN